MSFLTREVAHCDICGHEWLTTGIPTHCAKCKGRKWNVRLLAKNDKPYWKESNPSPIKTPDVALKASHDDHALRPAEMVSEKMLSRLDKRSLEAVESAYKKYEARRVPRAHDSKTCRIYKCGMCAAMKETE